MSANIVSSFYFVNKFSRSDSRCLLEIPPGGRTLTVSDIIEQLMNVGVRILFKPCRNIVYTALGQLFDECHACIALERFSYICSV